MSPRKVRRVANRDLDIMACEVESAHFNIAAHIVEKLVTDIEGPYCELTQVR